MAVFWFTFGLVHRVQLEMVSAENTLLSFRAKFYMQPFGSRPLVPLPLPPLVSRRETGSSSAPSHLAYESFATEAGHILTASHEGFGARQTRAQIPVSPLFSCVTLSKSLNLSDP